MACHISPGHMALPGMKGILIMMKSLNPEWWQLLEEEFKNNVKGDVKAVHEEFYYVVLQ